MKFLTTAMLAAALLPATALAQKQEILAVQRDVANLIDDVRRLEKAVSELKGLVQQDLEASQKASTSVEGMRGNIKEELAAPIAALNTRLDQITNEFQSLRNSFLDVNDRMGKLQQGLVDLNQAIKILQAPPTPPPSATPAAPTGPPAGMTSQQLYDSANRDRLGGNFDLALQQYQDYLKYYGDTELAPNAQFYVGQVYYDRGEFGEALKAFDTVLERYPENNKTPDAMYMKGMALLRSNQRNEAAKEFLNVIEKYPRSDVAEKARAQRRALGLSVPSSKPAKSRSR